MALIRCPECKNSVSNQAHTCPKCGYPIQKYLLEQEEKKRAKQKEIGLKLKHDAELKKNNSITTENIDDVGKKKGIRKRIVIFIAILAIGFSGILSYYKFYLIPKAEINMDAIISQVQSVFQEKGLSNINFYVKYPSQWDKTDTYLVVVDDDILTKYGQYYLDAFKKKINEIKIENYKIDSNILNQGRNYNVSSSSSSSSSTPISTTHKIKYKIEAPGTIDVTYQDSNGNTSQVNDTYTSEFTVTAEIGDFYYMSVQNQENHGSIKITMYVDGQNYVSNTSSGEYCIATVSGTLE